MCFHLLHVYVISSYIDVRAGGSLEAIRVAGHYFCLDRTYRHPVPCAGCIQTGKKITNFSLFRINNNAICKAEIGDDPSFNC